MILRGVKKCYTKFRNLGDNETKFINILNHWSVAQAGSNDEENPEVENLVGLSF